MLVRREVQVPDSKLTWYEPIEEAQEQPEQRKVDPEEAARLVMKAALIQTTGTPGWSFIQKFAETILREIEAASIAEEDDVKANGLRRDARGARKFKELLFQRVMMARNVDTKDGFVEVVMD
jgi:hypothetical protein